jgi:hypothetical protein
VGFLHRVILDHLAGQYLATLPVDAQAEESLPAHP